MTTLQHSTPEHEVVVAGAGPVGLLLAAELAQAGVDVAVVERRTEPDTTIKAGSVTGAAVAVLDRRGLLEPALEVQARALASIADGPGRRPAGPPTAGHFAGFGLRLDLIDRDEGAVDHGPAPFALLIPQAELETILRAHAEALGVTVQGGSGVAGVEQDDDGVWVVDEAGRRRRTAWLVGADGGRSVVRRSAGFAFPGTDPEITGRQALVELEGADAVEAGWHHGASGVYCLGPLPGRVLTVEFGATPADRDAPVTAEELTSSLRRVTGADVRVTAVHSATRWTDHARLAATYRRGRVLLAGDAAHVHAPFGGQGLGLGLADAVNLGWKLAAVVAGRAGETLLETYDAERRPPAEAVLDLTRAQVALMRTDAKTLALRRLAASALSTRAGATGVASLLAGPSAAPVPGSAAPEVRLDDGRRLAEVARDGRFTLVGDAAVRAVGTGRGQVTTAPAAAGMLVRPDGVVAWTGDDLGALRDALDRWCPDGALSRT